MPQFDDRLQESKLEELHHKEEESFIRSLAPTRGYQYVDLHDVSIDVEALRLLPEDVARKAELAVFDQGNGVASVAAKNPDSAEVAAALEPLRIQGLEPVLFMASLYSIGHAWERYKDARKAVAERRGVLDVDPEQIRVLSEEITSHEDVTAKILEVRNKNSAERVTETIEVLFGGALALSASDIHIEPGAANVRVRYRLDGVLWDITDITQEIYKLVISRLKLLSGLKLNVHNEAQDGRFTLTVGNRTLEIRSSVIPGAYGESMVMRLLDPSMSGFTIDSLGLNTRLHEVMSKELSRPTGAVLTTGPTGSGKTTALYAFLQEVHKPEVKIITIEDPVEYKLPDIVQTQVDDEYTFAIGLRAVLRQDPDVIMVGEIRDREVAETAVNAAFTGHLVFSTLHTNSAVGAFPRLIDLGISPRMIGGAFNIVLGQRLVRRLCESCKTERDATTEEQALIARIMQQPVALQKVFEASGCDACGGSGYRGRVGIYEGILVDEAVEKAVIDDPREINILAAAAPQEIPSMQQDGMMKVLAGVTSLEELERVVDLYRANEISDEKEDAAVHEHTVEVP